LNNDVRQQMEKKKPVKLMAGFSVMSD